MNRRDILKMPAAAGALTVVSVESIQAAVPQSIVNATWTPALFDGHQNDTVIALTERMIPRTDTPGAKDALVNRYLDKILRDGPPPQRVAFIEGLSWLDGYALRTTGKPFAACTEAQQVELLSRLESGAEPGNAPGTSFFRLAKRLTVQIYYATQAGVQELNKGGRVPESFGCSHSNHE